MNEKEQYKMAKYKFVLAILIGILSILYFVSLGLSHTLLLVLPISVSLIIIELFIIYKIYNDYKRKKKSYQRKKSFIKEYDSDY